MNKCINVNILMETLKKCRDGWSKVNNGYLAVNEVIESVETLPTVDAVPVTRCRDCRHYTGKWCTIYSTKQFDINDIYKGADDFCSQAERKEE